MSTLEYLCTVCLIYNKMHDNHGPFFVFISSVNFYILCVTLDSTMVIFVLFALVGFSCSHLAHFLCTVFDEIIVFKESNYTHTLD